MRIIASAAVRAAVLCASLAAVGCAMQGDYRVIAPRPPAQYEELGRVEGRNCGELDNERAARAYAQALGRAPGATRLVNVRLREDIGYGYQCAVVSGMAIK